MDNHIFRSAALGFNRQDVTEYIEKVQKEAEAKSAGLEAMLETARQEGDASRQALEECTQERDRLQEELADLKERYEAETEARDTAQAESARQKERLQALEAENRALKEQVQAQESRAEDLRREKERLTQLELDAHHRSDELLAQAQAQADAILAGANVQSTEIQAQARAQADTLLEESRKRITASAEKSGELLRSFEALSSHVHSELRKLETLAAQLPNGVDQLKSSLMELVDPEAGEK